MLIIWCLLTAVRSAIVAADADCEPGLDGRYYRRELLYQTPSRHFNYFTTVNWKTNMLYFTTKTSESADQYASAVMDLSKKPLMHTIIQELPGWCRFAVDQQRGEVYAGCDHRIGHEGGLFKYDSNVKKFVLISEQVKDVQYIQYGDALYFIDFNNNLYKFIHGRVQKVSEVQDDILALAVQPNGDKIFYSLNDSYVHFQKANSKESVTIEGSYGVFMLTLDNLGDAYGCTLGGIQTLNTSNLSSSQVFNAFGCDELTTDSEGNFIYTEYYTANIFRLIKCTTP